MLCTNNNLLLLGGWDMNQSYRFKIVHQPDSGLIRAWLWEGAKLIEDSGDIIDKGADSLKGGR